MTACNPDPEATTAVCHDGVDNDCDGAVDCADSACVGLASETCGGGTCSDGADNDCDGAVDCADAGCRCVGSYELCSTAPALCGDGVDNDCMDGTDCADWGCADCC